MSDNGTDDFPQRYRQAHYDEIMYKRWKAIVYSHFLENPQTAESYAAIHEQLMPMFLSTTDLSEAYRLLNQMTSVVIDAIDSPEWRGCLDRYDHRQALNEAVDAAYERWVEADKPSSRQFPIVESVSRMSDNDQPLKSVSIPDYVVIERENQRIAIREFRREQNDPAQLEGLTQPEINQLIDDWNKRIELYDTMPQAQRDLLTSIKSTGELKVDIQETDALEHAKALEKLALVDSSVNAIARCRVYCLTELGRKFLYTNGL